MRPHKFRYNAAITVAAVVAFFGAVPLATSRLYLLPIALVPILVGVWGWRAGTDVTSAGLRIRALFGSRFIPWSHVTALVPAGRRGAYAVLTTGRQVRLPAVGADDLATFADEADSLPSDSARR
ncbi:PH domain-containing protein [Planosporangium sp. 12N6]|uniref:PH domain-containing protein n=1 Tax=Planosporangium spinosum TaxID=3402278 RepID=UPI003CEB9E51